MFQQESVVAKVRGDDLQSGPGDAVGHSRALLHGEQDVAVNAYAKGFGCDTRQRLFHPAAAAAEVVGVDAQREVIIGLGVQTGAEFLPLILLI